MRHHLRLIYSILSFLLLQTCCAKPVPGPSKPDPLRLLLWSNTQIEEDGVWKAPPTWHGTYTLSQVTTALPDLFKGVTTANAVKSTHIIGVAQELFENLEKDYSRYANGDRQVITTRPIVDLTNGKMLGGGTCLVAVLWDPVAGRFTASTIPRGSRAQYMADQAARRARTWYSRIKYLFDQVEGKPNSTPNFHAEDGVYFGWEDSPASAGRIVNNAYQGGLVIGAYGAQLSVVSTKVNGKIVHNLSKTFVKRPTQWSLCAGDRRTPNCNRVAGMLRVNEASRVR